MSHNLFTNGIDMFDQLRAANTNVRQERHVTMYVFKFLFDYSTQNAYAPYRAIWDRSRPLMFFFNIKRNIAESLVGLFFTMQQTETYSQN